MGGRDEFARRCPCNPLQAGWHGFVREELTKTRSSFAARPCGDCGRARSRGFFRARRGKNEKRPEPKKMGSGLVGPIPEDLLTRPRQGSSISRGTPFPPEGSQPVVRLAQTDKTVAPQQNIHKHIRYDRYIIRTCECQYRFMEIEGQSRNMALSKIPRPRLQFLPSLTM
jgi:hypothetical protein